MASPKPATNPIPEGVTIAPAVIVDTPEVEVNSLPVTVTGDDPAIVGLPGDEVTAIPVGEITPVPTTVKDPRLEVIALPEGKAVLPIAIATVPTVASSSGSLPATTVNVESPDIENVPIEAAD